MVLPVLRMVTTLLLVILLFWLLLLPVYAAPAEGEISLREDYEMLSKPIGSITAGLGVVVCMALIFIIVWKEARL